MAKTLQLKAKILHFALRVLIFTNMLSMEELPQ